MGSNSGHTLTLRIVSALILMPVVLYALIAGGWAFTVLMGAGFIVAVRELINMARLLPSPALSGLAGLAYLIIGFGAFYYLRMYYPDGMGLALALMLCIWASDTGAYFAGKLIGGPKMAPSISPNKTWAGLIGGMVSSAAIFALYVRHIGGFLTEKTGLDFGILEEAGASMAFMLFIGACMTLCGQAGDLLESHGKRKAGLKDSGALIPGHGGILDRIDSLLFAAPVFVLLLAVFLS